jgi:hypothetical protein
LNSFNQIHIAEFVPEITLLDGLLVGGLQTDRLDKGAQQFDRLTKPTALIYNLDLVSKVKVLIFAPLDMLPQQTGIIRVCGHYKVKPIVSLNEYFFYADSITRLSSQTN